MVSMNDLIGGIEYQADRADREKHMECGEKGIIFQTIAPYAVHVSHEKYPDFSEWQIYG